MRSIRPRLRRGSTSTASSSSAVPSRPRLRASATTVPRRRQHVAITRCGTSLRSLTSRLRWLIAFSWAVAGTTSTAELLSVPSPRCSPAAAGPKTIEPACGTQVLGGNDADGRHPLEAYHCPYGQIDPHGRQRAHHVGGV